MRIKLRTWGNSSKSQFETCWPPRSILGVRIGAAVTSLSNCLLVLPNNDINRGLAGAKGGNLRNEEHTSSNVDIS